MNVLANELEGVLRAKGVGQPTNEAEDPEDAQVTQLHDRDAAVARGRRRSMVIFKTSTRLAQNTTTTPNQLVNNTARAKTSF